MRARSCAQSNPRAIHRLWEFLIVVEIEAVWPRTIPMAHTLSTVTRGRKYERMKLLVAALHISRPSTTATKYFNMEE
jgi:hypothetical protein